jgi:hypothetical protein
MTDAMEIGSNEGIPALPPLPSYMRLAKVMAKLAISKRRDSRCGGSNSAAPVTLDEDESGE